MLFIRHFNSLPTIFPILFGKWSLQRQSRLSFLGSLVLSVRLQRGGGDLLRRRPELRQRPRLLLCVPLQLVAGAAPRPRGGGGLPSGRRGTVVPALSGGGAGVALLPLVVLRAVFVVAPELRRRIRAAAAAAAAAAGRLFYAGNFHSGGRGARKLFISFFGIVIVTSPHSSPLIGNLEIPPRWCRIGLFDWIK